MYSHFKVALHSVLIVVSLYDNAKIFKMRQVLNSRLQSNRFLKETIVCITTKITWKYYCQFEENTLKACQIWFYKPVKLFLVSSSN